VNHEPLFILLDTGVDPSTIDLHRAEALHLKIDRNAGGRVTPSSPQLWTPARAA